MSRERLHRLALEIISSLVESEDVARVELHEDGPHLMVTLIVAPNDTGKIIGKHGYLAEAIRSILHAAAHRFRLQDCLVVIHDPRPEMRKKAVGSWGANTHENPTPAHLYEDTKK